MASTPTRPAGKTDRRHPRVTIYTMPTCPYCSMAKKWLTDHKITYKEVNVLEDDRGRDHIIKKSGKTTAPQIEIDDRVIVGFDKEELERTLL